MNLLKPDNLFKIFKVSALFVFFILVSSAAPKKSNKQIINEQYDRIYAYDIKNNAPTFDYQVDPTESNIAINSKIISLSQRDTITGKFKIRG